MDFLLFRVAFEGANYHGSQVQPGVDTINAQLEKARDKLKLQGVFKYFSRLDAGVNAKDFPCVLKLKKQFKGNLLLAFNSALPDDIKVRKIILINDELPIHHLITSKIYRYYVYRSNSVNPLINRYVTRIHPRIDLEKSKEILPYFLGEHDFVNFKTTGSSVKTSVRTIDHFNYIQLTKSMSYFEVQGKGFLKNQVRIMVGSIIAYCDEKLSKKEIMDLLEAKDITKKYYPRTMAPRGLMLHKVNIKKGYIINGS